MSFLNEELVQETAGLNVGAITPWLFDAVVAEGLKGKETRGEWSPGSH